MKMSRKILGMILCCSLLLSMLAMAAYAKSSFVIRGSQAAAHAGEQVTVDIVLENNPGISALNLYYHYDSKYLTLKQVENRVSAFTMTNDVTTVWDAVSNYRQDGLLATLTFEVAENAPIGDYEMQIYFLSAANEDFEEVKATAMSAKVTVTSRGCELKGTVRSYGSATEEVTLQLFEAGSNAACQTVRLKGNSASYSLKDVPYGTYTLKVSKKNHVTRTYTLRLDEAKETLDLELHLLGDADGNGQVNLGDLSRVYAHIKGTSPLTDEYQLQCGDVNGGGVNIGDVSVLYAHIKGTRKLH